MAENRGRDRFEVQRQIRVSVSSTFRDMQFERDELVKRVFPRLRKICENEGLRGAKWTFDGASPKNRTPKTRSCQFASPRSRDANPTLSGCSANGTDGFQIKFPQICYSRNLESLRPRAAP